MKIFIPVLSLMCLAMAEPPVGDGYPAARSSDHHDHGPDSHSHDLQRSLSQEYGAPLSRTSDYANARNGQNQRNYAPPTARVSFTQRFTSRNSNLASAKRLSQAPATRGISQEYGAPNTRSLSQEYGVPSIASARSGDYTNARSLSQEYGTPIARSGKPSFRSAKAKSQFQPRFNDVLGYEDKSLSRNAPSSTYGVPSTYSAPSSAYSAPSSTYGAPSSSYSAPSSTYGVPSSRSLSASYGAPTARDSEAYSQEHSGVSQTYGPPSQRSLSDTYGVPSARDLSQEYGVPSSRGGQTNARASSYSSGAPSSTYLPSSRSMPSSQYGAPDAGYDYAKARALNELLNQQPANYDFTYEIEDNESGTDFGHSESRVDDRAEGTYFVVLPDGTKQTVEYEADEEGFKPRISLEPVGGYDQNASDGTNNGPY